MSTQMEVDTPKTTDREEASIAIHPVSHGNGMDGGHVSSFSYSTSV
jgi:hypothetical protein